MNVLVSFIVPVYKVEESYLKACVDSLIAISHKEIEVLLIDDGSPDQCGQLCDDLAALDARIRVFHKENGGVSSARNYGIDHARGEYITFIDADDWIDAPQMDAIISEVEAQEYEVYLYGQYIDFKDRQPIEVRPFHENRFFETREEMDVLQRMVFVRDYGSLRSNGGAGVVCNAVDKIIRLSFLKQFDCRFDENLHLGEDGLFYLNLFHHCRSAMYLDICSYHYRMRRSSASHAKSSRGYHNIAVFFGEAQRMLRMQGKEQSCLDALYYRCFDLLLEQFDRAYLDVPRSERSLVEKIRMLNKELAETPFAEALKRLEYRYFDKKTAIKVFLFKHHMAGLFLLFKEIKRGLGNDRQELQSYYR